MLSSRNLNSSPVKQNISPERDTTSPKKQANIIKQLLNILKYNNISIPSQLLSNSKLKKVTSQITLKQFKPLTDQSKENKQLRIKVSDYQFQLKKLQQDYAEFKVIARLEKEKLIKKYNLEIASLKKKIDQDNCSWENRFRQANQDHQKDKKQFENRILRETQLRILQIKQQLELQYSNQIEELQQKKEQLQLQLSNKGQKAQKEKIVIIKQYELKKTEEVKELNESHLQKQKEITEKLQNKIALIQTQRKVQCQKLEEDILQVKISKEKLKNDIYYLNKDKQELKCQIKAKQKNILQLQLTIKAKQQAILQQKHQSQSQKLKLVEQHAKEMKQSQQMHAKEIKEIMNVHLNQLDSYYNKINSKILFNIILDLQERKMIIEQQYKEEIQILENKFQQRVSKSEDIDRIQELKSTLTLKEREIERFKDELKKTELSIKNNQKNYTKLFSSTTGRRKSSGASFRDKQAFFRQTNPTDLKLLLKICNKDF